MGKKGRADHAVFLPEKLAALYLNPMLLGIRQLLLFSVGCAMHLPIVGCGAFGGVMATAAMEGALIGAGLPSASSPPKISCIAEDSMTIRYGFKGSGSFDIHNEAMRLISKHCEGGYVETHRQEYGKFRKIYVACLQSDGSPPQSPSCIYVIPEESPVGFGNYDPATGE